MSLENSSKVFIRTHIENVVRTLIEKPSEEHSSKNFGSKTELETNIN
jgi:hypothetical protein